jgi:hypothetical protein
MAMTTPKTDDVTTLSACAHRWVLAAAGEEGTLGTCRLCNSVRIFTDARRARPHYDTSPRAPLATTARWGASTTATTEAAR